MQFVESDEPMELKVRRLSNRVQFKFEAWDEYLKRYPGLKDKDIRFAFDEWSPRNRAVGGGPRARQPPDAEPADERPRLPRVLPPLGQGGPRRRDRRHGDAGERRLRRRDRPAHGGARDEAAARPLRGRAAGRRRRQLSAACPRRERSRSTPRRALREARPTRSTSSRRSSADRKTLAVSVVNPTEQPQECELDLAGVQATGPAKVYQLTAHAAAPPRRRARPRARSAAPRRRWPRAR